MQRIGLIVFPGFQVMSCAVTSAFEFANREMGRSVYNVRLLSEHERRERFAGANVHLLLLSRLVSAGSPACALEF
jgi:transcriptional regulator GlxA family with amidase domain